MTATVYPAATAQERAAAVEAVDEAMKAGRTAVVPTDTVYGIAADAFSPGGVGQLLSAKGRSRRMPPPVLISGPQVLPALGEDLGDDVLALADAFWPGAMTLIVYMNPSLNWDLGETNGTVALRVPDDDLTREILEKTGPLAVSSANRTGRTAATTAQEAQEQLGERVEAIVDGGIRPLGRDAATTSEEVLPSTIVDCTGDRPVVVREGAVGIDAVRDVVPSALTRQELREQRAGARGGAGGSHAARTASDDTEGAGGPAAAADGADSDGSDSDGSGVEDSEDTARSSAVRGPAGGPRAGAPAEGSVAAAVTTGSAGGGAVVDQLRTRSEGGSGGTSRRPRAEGAKPVSVEAARALVHGRAASDDGAQTSQSPGPEEQAEASASVEPPAATSRVEARRARAAAQSARNQDADGPARHAPRPAVPEEGQGTRAEVQDPSGTADQPTESGASDADWTSRRSRRGGSTPDES